MKSTLIFATAATFFLASCSKQSRKGEGSILTETRSVAAFSGVRIEGSGNVQVVQGTQQKVEVRGYENLLQVYRTFVSNGVLVVKFDDDYHNIRNNNIEVSIVIPGLNYASINGSGKISIDNFSGSLVEVEINGSGDVYTTNNVYTTSRLSINGSGYLRGRQIQCDHAVTSISGSGKIDVSCQQKLEASIQGSGEINYWGSPDQVETNVSGIGKVNKKF